jgi:peptidyl-prolyl cis-trans isomerase C
MAALALVLLGACGRGDKPATEGQTGDTAAQNEVLAKISGDPIRAREIEELRERVPAHQRSQYEGARGTLRLLNQLVDRDLLVKAAVDAGLEKDPEVAKQMEEIRRSLLLQYYQKKLVDALPKPSDEDIRKYFDEHPEEFEIPARVNASWIKCATKADAEKARRRIIVKGEDFGTVAREVSIDRASARDGGLLGYFNPTGYIRSVGPDTAFARKAFELEAGDIGEVFQYQDGWAFIKIHEKTTERAEPFERAQDRIRGRLTPGFTEELLQQELARLRSKYKVEIMLDVDKELEGKSADELMRLATEATEPHDKIDYYEALLRRYPTYARADEARFMIGFMYSEELHDLARARVEYEKVLSDYPQSSIRESAQYMLQHMGEGAQMPDFEEPPDTGVSVPAPAPEPAPGTPQTR